MCLQIPGLHIKKLAHPCQLPKAQNSRYRLGNGRSQGNAENSQSQACDEPYIQDDVDDRSHQQVYQCGNGIPQSPEDAAQDVIISHAGDPVEQDGQIGRAPVDDAGRRM